MKIALLYFSGTGITKKYASIILHEFNVKNIEIDSVDITALKSRQNIQNLRDYSGFIFGFPVYGNKIPSVCKNWIEQLEHDKMTEGPKTAQFFTFGGRGIGSIHQETAHLLQTKGFRIIGSADFLGAHSLNVGEGWDILADRPNQKDIESAQEFAHILITRFQSTSTFSPSLPEKDMQEYKNTNPPKKAPSRDPNPYLPRRIATCQMCNACEENCASGSFNATTGEADPDTCIKCQKCLVDCPDHAIALGDLTTNFQNYIESNGVDLIRVREKQSHIYL